MNNSFGLVALAVLTFYFGLQLIRIMPTLFRLLLALSTGAVTWPGPRIHDMDRNASIVRARLGTGYQNLFSAFMWNSLSAAGAFMYFLLAFFSQTSWLRGYVVIKSPWALYLFSSLAFLGGIISFKKARQNNEQVKLVLSDLDKKVEPRAVDGHSAEAEYAIEHPVIRLPGLAAEKRKVFDWFYESTCYLWEGKAMKAAELYQQALTINPSFHQDARELLSRMLQSSPNGEEEGAICYWLGIHSEYLSDLGSAAMWYERAADAYHNIGYEKRESRAHCNLGHVKMQMRDPTGMSEFEKAIALNPKNGTAHLNIARMYYLASNPGEPQHDLALDAFAQAIVADPLTYGPKVISSLRGLGYTWQEDLEKITQRVERLHAVTSKDAI